ncbi:hypothetical protein [Bacillus sp. FJAT-29814]|uniref:hypothetical protein n=1 Tax=Bacillus sp. FJAT-29814 TaxID=1729688 RepID=UPI00082BCA35|nr:hypothetical protein [Bacillus sp. FJAT-29814]
MKNKKNKPKKQFSRRGQCIVEGCNGYIEASQLCGKHYAKMRRRGKNDNEIFRIGELGNCLAVNCTNSYYAEGYCEHHYYVYIKLGYPQMPKVIKLCGAENCSNILYLKGLCEIHYNEWIAKLKNYHLSNQILKD